MNIKKIKKLPKITLMLYIYATIMLVFAIFNIYTSNKYIEGLMLQGFKPAEQMTDVIKFYIEAVTPYVFYSICITVLGYIVKILKNFVSTENELKEVTNYEERQIVKDEEEDIVEELLRESKSI